MRKPTWTRAEFVFEWIGGSVLFGGIGVRLLHFEISPLATFCLPVLAVFFAFAALLYNRARALPTGPEQRRTLYAAERAMQATAFYMAGTAMGAVLIFILVWFNYQPSSAEPGSVPFPLGLFIFPLVLMFWGYMCFAYAARAIGTRLLRRRSMKEILRFIGS